MLFDESIIEHLDTDIIFTRIFDLLDSFKFFVMKKKRTFF